jgi:cyclic pyranopterin monophosphate synthase
MPAPPTPAASTLTHFDAGGAARMVDVAAKPETARTATASAVVTMAPATLELIQDRKIAKGDVFAVARLAGIMAAKRTPDLIPLCHPLPLSSVEVAFEAISADSVCIRATVGVFGRTGVEMEALTAVTVAALTVYDMIKSVDRGATVTAIRLDAKSGGRSGEWTAEPDPR